MRKLVLLLCLLAQPALAADATDFAILHPPGSYQETGVSPNETKALHAMMSRFGWTYQDLSFDDLNQPGTLTVQRFRCLVVPGGPIRAREEAITPEGDRNIEAFVSAGGSYIGFCGGAFQACGTMMWCGKANDQGLNRAYRKATLPMGLPLFEGAGWGPLAWHDRATTPHTMETVMTNTAVPALRQAGVPPFTHIHYAGGPAFAPGNYDVWAWAVKPATVQGTDLVGDHWPSIIHLTYGQGQVILCSYHPSVIPGGRINGVQVEPAFKTVASLPTSPEDNYQSWNLLHAALQTLLQQPVTRLVIH